MKKFLSKFKSKRGMTYVELIVVLSIFAIMSTVVLFDYNKFQERVEIKRLANQIALKFVEAQKSAMAGKIPTNFLFGVYKPSYGLYFNIDNLTNKTFVYFTDLDAHEDVSNNNQISQNGYDFNNPGSETIQTIQITKGNYIERIDVNGSPVKIGRSFLFTRPFSNMKCYDSNGSLISNFSSVEITISSPKNDFKAVIKIDSLGRVQIN